MWFQQTGKSTCYTWTFGSFAVIWNNQSRLRISRTRNVRCTSFFATPSWNSFRNRLNIPLQVPQRYQAVPVLEEDEPNTTRSWDVLDEAGDPCFWLDDWSRWDSEMSLVRTPQSRFIDFIDDEYWWIMNDHECHVLFLDQWREKPWSLTNPGNGWQWKIPILRMISHESWVFGISHCHANSNWTIECFGKGIGSITCTKLSPKSWWEDGAVHPWNSPRPGGIRWLIMVTHQFAIFSFLLNGNLGIYHGMPHFQTDPFLENFATGHVLPFLLNHLKSKGGATGATSQSLFFFFFARHYQHCNCEPPTHLVRSQEIARIFFSPPRSELIEQSLDVHFIPSPKIEHEWTW